MYTFVSLHAKHNINTPTCKMNTFVYFGHNAAMMGLVYSLASHLYTALFTAYIIAQGWVRELVMRLQ